MSYFILAQKMVQTFAPKFLRWVENNSSLTWLELFLLLLLLFGIGFLFYCSHPPFQEGKEYPHVTYQKAKKEKEYTS